MKRRLAAIALVAVLVTGCSTTRDPYTGQTRHQLNDAGKIAVGLLVAGAAITAAAYIGNSDDSPDRVYETTCSGSKCTTEVYE